MKRVLFVFVIVVFTILSAGCKKGKKLKKEIRRVPVVLTNPKKIKVLEKKVKYPATIEALNEVKVFPQAGVSGKIRYLYVKENQYVYKGAALGLIDREMYGFANSVIKAPISGYIAMIIMKEGSFVGPTTPIMTIINRLDIVKAVLQVPEKDIPLIKVGNRDCYITHIAYPDEKWWGYVSRKSIYVDPRSRTQKVEILVKNSGLKNPKNKLFPGMLSLATITIKKVYNPIVVPLKSILSYEGKREIFLYKKGSAKEYINITKKTNLNIKGSVGYAVFKEANIGLVVSELVEVYNLSTNDMIVEFGGENLKNYDLVQVVSNF